MDQNKKINNHYVENVVCIFFIFDHILNEIISYLYLAYKTKIYNLKTEIYEVLFLFLLKRVERKNTDTDEK